MVYELKSACTSSPHVILTGTGIDLLQASPKCRKFQSIFNCFTMTKLTLIKYITCPTLVDSNLFENANNDKWWIPIMTNVPMTIKNCQGAKIFWVLRIKFDKNNGELKKGRRFGISNEEVMKLQKEKKREKFYIRLDERIMNNGFPKRKKIQRRYRHKTIPPPINPKNISSPTHLNHGIDVALWTGEFCGVFHLD